MKTGVPNLFMQLDATSGGYNQPEVDAARQAMDDRTAKEKVAAESMVAQVHKAGGRCEVCKG